MSTNALTTTSTESVFTMAWQDKSWMAWYFRALGAAATVYYYRKWLLRKQAQAFAEWKKQAGNQGKSQAEFETVTETDRWGKVKHWGLYLGVLAVGAFLGGLVWQGVSYLLEMFGQ